MRNLFNQARRIADFKREVDFLSRQLEFTEQRAISAEARIVKLDKRVEFERSKFDKFVYVAMDKLTKNAGTFQKSLLPPVVEKLVELSPDEQSQIEWVAQLNRDADVDAGYEPQPLEFYIDAIKADPQKYSPS